MSLFGKLLIRASKLQNSFDEIPTTKGKNAAKISTSKK
jgi:hypothetical protein